MTVAAVSMVRNEIDVIEHVVRHMLCEVDYVMIADNNSTDGTRDLLSDLERQESRLTVFDRIEPGYYQSAAMSGLAAMAAEDFEADWILPFDADELWFARDDRRIADVLAELPPSFLVAEADIWDHVATAHDADVENPFDRLRWRRHKALPLPKVACRYREGMVIEQGNHGVRYPGNGWQFKPTATNLLTIRHFPYRSPSQFVAKVRSGAAAYAATDLPPSIGAHWRQWGAILDAEGPAVLEQVFYKWFWRDSPLSDIHIDDEHQPALVYDPIWATEEAEVLDG